MRNLKLATRALSMFGGRMGLIVALWFLIWGIVVWDDSFVAASRTFAKESKGKADSQSSFTPGGDTKENESFPVIGGGVRTPPDIGASGTASPTPPVRTESPTDEPQILPDVSPVPTHPTDTEISPAKEGQPLGQPDQIKNRKEIGGSLQ